MPSFIYFAVSTVDTALKDTFNLYVFSSCVAFSIGKKEMPGPTSEYTWSSTVNVAHKFNSVCFVLSFKQMCTN